MPGYAARHAFPDHDKFGPGRAGTYFMTSLRQIYDRLLETIAVILMIAVTAIVTLGVVYRWIGESLVWYDELASISLCWLTYYAGALAALRGAHIGFSGFVNSLPARWRVAATVISSAVTMFFFGVLAVMGTLVVQILKGDTLVSIPELSLQITQSVIPIASVLFVIAELLRLPGLVREARRGPLVDHELLVVLEHGKAGKELAGKDIRP
jgi:TRAP-type C4-dicarboxylate transport system permease small subunit